MNIEYPRWMMFLTMAKVVVSYWFCFIRNTRKIHGRGNKLIFGRSWISSGSFDIKGNDNVVEFGLGAVVKDLKIFVHGNNNRIKISDFCNIKAGELWIEDNRCEIDVGKKTTIEEAHIACTEDGSKVSIGEDVMLANDIDIRTGDSHSIIDLKSHKRINYAKNVVIKDHVWVASRAIILKGVTIGKNSVVATGSIVTKDVSANSIYGGIPAKLIKSGVTWTRERII